uniref:FBD domain-containing protein n=1 Tax=Panagrellus redivivus TaxID=6233 RepID=A0A7E4WCU9_PANRE
MASLKYHLLREVADIVFRDSSIWSRYTSRITSFVLSGKEPSLILRRMVQNEVITAYPDDGALEVTYGKHEVDYENLPVLLVNWARRLIIYSEDDWLQYSGAYDWENEDLEELCVVETEISNWPKIFQMFPNLVSLNLAASQFDDMLRGAPNKLAGLEEIGITFPPLDEIDDTDVCLADTCMALCKHQSKYPALKVVHLKEVDLGNEFKYPKPSKVIPMPSVKHLKMAAVHDYTSFNLKLLTTIQKLFPSLETLDMDVEAQLCEENLGLENINKFYKAFHSLSVGFDLNVKYREELTSYDIDISQFRNLIVTKGTVTEKDGLLTVKTCLPGKAFIREVSIKNFYGFHYL